LGSERVLLAECSVSLFLAGRRLLKKSEALLERGSVRFAGCGPRPLHDANRLTGREPIQIVSRTNSVLVGDRLRKRKLELARNLSHDQKYSKDSFLVQSLFNVTPRTSPETFITQRLTRRTAC
jgi:hypothetical protein